MTIPGVWGSLMERGGQWRTEASHFSLLPTQLFPTKSLMKQSQKVTIMLSVSDEIFEQQMMYATYAQREQV